MKPRKGSASAPAPQKQSSSTRRKHYLIQIERPGKTLTMDDIRHILAGTGVEVDEGYGPVVVNPDLGRHAVRGWADDESRQRAEDINGIRFFGDPRIAPLGPPR